MVTLLVVTSIPGCGDGAVTTKPKKRPIDSSSDEDVPRAAVVAKGYGKITGKVVYDGTPPSRELQVFPSAAMVPCCEPKDPKFESDKYKQEWVIDESTKGVMNAVVILQPPSGMFFDLPADQQVPKQKEVVVDQPYCAFHPRVFTVFPNYFDKTTQSLKPTGQVLVVSNTANCEHNYKLSGDSSVGNPSISRLLPQGKKEPVILYPQEKPLPMACDIHTFMRAYGFILEHPYVAVTDDKGNFVIENAPLGVDLQVVGWHEVPGYFNGGDQGRKMNLSDGQVLETFKIKAK